MSRRSRAAYYSALERPVSWCEAVGCRNRRARYSKADKRQLCKICRQKLKAAPQYRCPECGHGTDERLPLGKFAHTQDCAWLAAHREQNQSGWRDPYVDTFNVAR